MRNHYAPGGTTRKESYNDVTLFFCCVWEEGSVVAQRGVILVEREGVFG